MQTIKEEVNTKPIVSIGLPVYNGENYLAKAIESVLAQTFTDFELILCDNASTDNTQAICERFAAQDPRIRYYRHEVNQGATWNFNFSFKVSSGIYFNWLAHDDELAPQYLERFVSILDKDPEIVLCFSKIEIIDEQSIPLSEFDVDLHTYSNRASVRFYDLLMVWHDCLPIFGLIRSSALRTTPLIGSYGLGDAVLLARLGLLGKFTKVDQNLFRSRRHALQSNKQFNIWVDHHAYDRWFAPDRSRLFYLPQWEVLFDLFWMVFQSNIPVVEKLASTQAVLRWSIRYRKLLIKDWIYQIRKWFSFSKPASDKRLSSHDPANSDIGI